MCVRSGHACAGQRPAATCVCSGLTHRVCVRVGAGGERRSVRAVLGVRAGVRGGAAVHTDAGPRVPQ
eukprot:1214238-Rhodomonas_salina.1